MLAANSGGGAGSLCSASQGVFQITPTLDQGLGLRTSTILKSARAVVTLEFAIEGKGR